MAGHRAGAAGHAGLWMGGAVAAYTLPGVVGALVFGRRVRRMPAKRLLLIDNIVRGVCLVVIPPAWLGGLLPLPLYVVLLAASPLLNAWATAGKYTPLAELLPAEQRLAGREARKPGTPGTFSRWMQRKANARANRKIRGGRGRLMGMAMLILTTVGRRSGQPRETPVAWYADRGPDGTNAWLIVASCGGSRHPDWHANLLAHPDRATIELPGRAATPVTPQRLSGVDRDRAWQRITAANPRMAKYQSKSDREYPVIRLTPA